ncbi:MAG: MBL fold metallo-hydrolase [Planctomycetota bacterium]
MADRREVRAATTPAPILDGTFPKSWIDGRDEKEPKIQIHAYNDTTYIFRQSLITDREAPFIYLLLGTERALLLDTGAGGIDLVSVVKAILDKHAQKIGMKDYPLIVAHSHSHGDHTAGDKNFVDASKPDAKDPLRATVVETRPADVAKFFKIKDWPKQIVTFDLGGRALEIIPIPGHEPSSIAIYDPNTAILLTGDTLYPGRIYVGDFKLLLESAERLVEFTKTRSIKWVLGTHIEMTAEPKKDFKFTALKRENERVLQLERRHVVELRDELLKMKEKPVRKALDDFIIYPMK